MIQFSDPSGKTGIVERTRKKIRKDSVQWPTVNIANSCNDWLDFIAEKAIMSDRRFQWDDINHTKLPEMTTSMAINQSDYSFSSDEQDNKLITLTGVSYFDGTYYRPLKLVDRNDSDYDPATFGFISGTVPTRYDKIADNIIRLDIKPSATVASGLKFYFQRTPSYFVAADTTKTPGVSPLLHRGFVIASAYDAAADLGLGNLQALAAERQIEEQKIDDYFATRNNDDPKPTMTMKKILYI